MSLQGPSEVLLEEQQNYSNSEQGISRESDVVPACPTELAVISEEDENKGKSSLIFSLKFVLSLFFFFILCFSP